MAVSEIAGFAELAAALKAIAWREAAGVEALELMAARFDDPRMALVFRQAKREAAHAGQAHALLSALVAHEDAVRALLASNTIA